MGENKGRVNGKAMATGRSRRAAPVRQRTLKSSIACSGVGLHSGAQVAMTLAPGEPDSGIIFVRTDIEGGGTAVPARWDRVVCTRLCTMIGADNGVTVGTIEHLMAAFAGTSIDNAVVSLNGPEVPIMDGSAAPFIFLVECAGIVEQDASRRAVRVKKPVEINEDGMVASLSPAPVFSVDVTIDFDSPAMAHHSLRLGLVNGTFKKELARARTFGFLHEVEKLRAAGFARGGSLDNAVVVSGDRVLNEGGLRYEDEFVRHKALDAVGDLYLAGGPLIGTFAGVRSGHRANNLVLRALFADKDAWTYDILREGEARVPAPASLAWTKAEEPMVARA